MADAQYHTLIILLGLITVCYLSFYVIRGIE